MAARRPVDVSGLVAQVREPTTGQPTTTASGTLSGPEMRAEFERTMREDHPDAKPVTQADFEAMVRSETKATRARPRKAAPKATEDVQTGQDQDHGPAGSQKQPTRQKTTRTAKTSAQGPSAPAPEQPDPTRTMPTPTVLAINTTEAKRVSLYLHPDDHRALGLARLDDGADANARIRAMIALWRANPRYRSQIDRLARTAPRGNH